MICSIHQPNFFPWYPFFQKIKNCDVFVLLTNCQFEKNNFQNRFNMNDTWYTMSVNKGLEPINSKKYVSYEKDWKNIKSNLPEYSKILNEFDSCISENLEKTNVKIIKKICKLLKIETQLVTDYPTTLKSTDRLIDLCKYYNSDKYLSGSSGSKYMDLTLFKNNNISITFQESSLTIKKPILQILKEIL